MIKLSNCHTHSVFCDGKDTIEHMAQRARDFGLVSLGFSGHGRQTNNAFGIQSEPDYAAEVRRVAALHEGRMKIWLGVEQDYFGYCSVPYDYRLGAVHYLDGQDGVNHPIDHSEVCFERMLREGFGGDALAMARAYYSRVVEMCRKNRPDVVVHYDLICKFNEDNRFFDESDPAYMDVSLQALEVICDGQRLLEVGEHRGHRPGTAHPALSGLPAAPALARAGRPGDSGQRLPRRGEAHLRLRGGAGADPAGGVQVRLAAGRGKRAV